MNLSLCSSKNAGTTEATHWLSQHESGRNSVTEYRVLKHAGAAEVIVSDLQLHRFSVIFGVFLYYSYVLVLLRTMYMITNSATYVHSVMFPTI